MNTPIRVAVTGAAGQIGYSLLFRIASGAMFGPHQPLILHLIEIEPAMPALQGLAMELEDGGFPLLKGVVATVQPRGRISRRELGAAGRQRAAQARHGAQGFAGRQRQDLCRPGPGAAEARRAGRAHPGGGQPLQHELPDHHAQRAGDSARPVLRHDAPGRESRQGAARQEGRPGCDARSPMSASGATIPRRSIRISTTPRSKASPSRK